MPRRAWGALYFAKNLGLRAGAKMGTIPDTPCGYLPRTVDCVTKVVRMCLNPEP